MLVKRIAAYQSIFNRFRAIARYWSEIATFSYPLAFNAPPLGVILLDDLRDFWWVSCRMARLGYNMYKKYPREVKFGKMNLYRSMVRPQLLLERVQRRFTRSFPRWFRHS